jgi:F5/8 type C domain/Pectate lyase superfamily protein
MPAAFPVRLVASLRSQATRVLVLLLAGVAMASLAMLAPADSGAAGSLLSKGRPASASSSRAGHRPAAANDGHSRTRWVAASDAFPQDWTVDLGSRKALGLVKLNCSTIRHAVFRYQILGSRNRTAWTVLAKGRTQRANGSASVEVEGSYRFVKVRVLSATRGRAELSEVRVYAAGDQSPSGPALGNAFSVMDFGARADGTTDDRAAITACARAAVAAGAAVYFPPGDYRLAGTMDAVAGAYYYAPADVTLRTQGSIHCEDGCTIDGFAFRSYGAGTAISMGGGAKGTVAHDVTVKDCSFAAGTAQYTDGRIVLYLAHGCRIDHNTFSGTAGSGGTIVVAGGDHNSITDNSIHGGTTCILFMWSRSSNGGGLDSIIEHNVITGNVYSGYSEEGISFDLKADDPADCGALEYDRVGGVSGQTITLSDLQFPDYVGYDIVFVDGALRGRTRTITSQSGHAFTVSGGLAGVGAGDRVVIGACFKDNYVADNEGTSVRGFPAILLYGLCFGNLIEHNTIHSGKIQVESLDYTVQAKGSKTLVGSVFGRAPCGYNTLRNNKVDAGTGNNINLQYWALHGSGTPFTTEGNNVIGNTAPLFSADHNCFFGSSNTGTYKDGGGNTEAASPFTYDGGG